MTSSETVSFSQPITVNDIRDKYYRGERLTKDEALALKNYESYQLHCLHMETDEARFHKKYLQLQVMANLSPYQEFLKDEYFNFKN